MSVSIIGAGAFGTALAISLAGRGTRITLWARDEHAVRAMSEQRQNAARLPGAPLPEAICPTSDIVQATRAGTILLAVPMQSLAHLLRENRGRFDGKRLVACCKGIDLTSLTGPASVIATEAPGAGAAILTGPSFAADIARSLPTALTLACADDAIGRKLQKQLSTPGLRLYRTTDVAGAELGGALKNVVAIACGIAIGAGLGESARAAIMTRGYAEMKRLATELGARPETLSGLSGFGDLALTCTSEQSRNYRFGLALGGGRTFDPGLTVEGAATARAVSGLAEKRGVELPITNVIASVLDRETTVPAAISALLTRPLREE